MMVSPSELCVVLVEPELPANIGFVARTCKAAGVAELRLVHPTWSELPDAARRTGTAALDVLDAARLFPSLAAALADLPLAVAFSRRRFAELPSCPLRELAARRHELGGGRTALVLGRESQGLSGDEVSRCRLVCGVPIRGTLSDNLGQAAAIVLYELCRRDEELAASPEAGAPVAGADERAPLGEIEALLERVAAHGGVEPGSQRQRQLRQLLLRAAPSSAEVRSLFGVVGRLGRG